MVGQGRAHQAGEHLPGELHDMPTEARCTRPLSARSNLGEQTPPFPGRRCRARVRSGRRTWTAGFVHNHGGPAITLEELTRRRHRRQSLVRDEQSIDVGDLRQLSTYGPAGRSIRGDDRMRGKRIAALYTSPAPRGLRWCPLAGQSVTSRIDESPWEKPFNLTRGSCQ